MVLGLFLRVKQLGCGVEHTPPSGVDVEERVEQYPLLPLWAFMACYRVFLKVYHWTLS